ncbi:MAG: hypothetical protein IPI24_13630 [Ignavibacteria bacterium]|nr:hypothetical protein [Ignavibacteria bacterium]
MKHLFAIAIAIVGTYIQGDGSDAVFDLAWTTLGNVEMANPTMECVGSIRQGANLGCSIREPTVGEGTSLPVGSRLAVLLRVDEDLRPRVIPTHVLTTGTGSCCQESCGAGRQVRPGSCNHSQLASTRIGMALRSCRAGSILWATHNAV